MDSKWIVFPENLFILSIILISYWQGLTSHQFAVCAFENTCVFFVGPVLNYLLYGSFQCLRREK